MNYHIISIVLAVISFVVVFVLGIKTNLLKEEKGGEMPYSFRKFQLWLWTLVLIPCFSLYWGFSADHIPAINITALILLGISGAATLMGEAIAATQKANMLSQRNNLQAGAQGFSLKALNVPSTSLWSDILKDDKGQVSIPRLQHLLFTVTFIAMYVSMFFTLLPARPPYFAYPVFDDNAFVLMGISTGTYLVGKGMNK